MSRKCGGQSCEPCRIMEDGLERQQFGDCYHSPEPDPRWGGWADMRKGIDLVCADAGERLVWASWEIYLGERLKFSIRLTKDRELENSWYLTLARH